MELTTPLINPDEKQVRERSQKMLLWISMISMVMVFAALTSAYILRQADGQWDFFNLPQVFFYSTAVLLISSLTINLTINGAKKDNQSMVKLGAISTLFLGLAFVLLQFRGWNELVEMGVYFTGTSSASGTFLYFLTGLHLAHLFAGMIVLMIVAVKGFKGRYTSTDHHGLRLAATFWHFLDILWIFLFLFLLFIR